MGKPSLAIIGTVIFRKSYLGRMIFFGRTLTNQPKKVLDLPAVWSPPSVKMLPTSLFSNGPVLLADSGLLVRVILKMTSDTQGIAEFINTRSKFLFFFDF